MKFWAFINAWYWFIDTWYYIIKSNSFSQRTCTSSNIPEGIPSNIISVFPPEVFTGNFFRNSSRNFRTNFTWDFFLGFFRNCYKVFVKRYNFRRFCFLRDSEILPEIPAGVSFWSYEIFTTSRFRNFCGIFFRVCFSNSSIYPGSRDQDERHLVSVERKRGWRACHEPSSVRRTTVDYVSSLLWCCANLPGMFVFRNSYI